MTVSIPDDKVIRVKAFRVAMGKGTLNYGLRLVWDDKSIHWIETVKDNLDHLESTLSDLSPDIILMDML